MKPTNSVLPTSLASLLFCTLSLAASEPFQVSSIPVYRRSSVRNDVTKFAQSQADRLLRRYRPELQAQRQRQREKRHVKSKKRTGSGVTTEVLTNYEEDTEYFGSIEVGTPSTNYFVLLDTGSSDLWLAAPDCSTCDTSTPTFSASQSSTLKTINQAFQTVYGSGEVEGTLVTDVVTMANYSASSQTFAVCSEISSGLLDGAISGIMGMGFQAISSANAVPFWQSAGIPEFAFALTRYDNDESASNDEPGGFVTIGGTNSSLYTGSINYVPLQSQSYWLIALDNLQVDGVTIASSSSTDVAIDTGTTLIGAPPSIVASAFAQISGSSAITDPSLSGYWQYPCSANPTLTLTFGGVTYTVSSADFNQGRVSGSRVSLSDSFCLGALFELPQSSDSPSWIVGDTFIKNVYTVFSSTQNAVGFAPLAASVESSNEEADKSPTGSVSVKSAGFKLHFNTINVVLGTFYFIWWHCS